MIAPDLQSGLSPGTPTPPEDSLFSPRHTEPSTAHPLLSDRDLDILDAFVALAGNLPAVAERFSLRPSELLAWYANPAVQEELDRFQQLSKVTDFCQRSRAQSYALATLEGMLDSCPDNKDRRQIASQLGDLATKGMMRADPAEPKQRKYVPRQSEASPAHREARRASSTAPHHRMNPRPMSPARPTKVVPAHAEPTHNLAVPAAPASHVNPTISVLQIATTPASMESRSALNSPGTRRHARVLHRSLKCHRPDRTQKFTFANAIRKGCEQTLQHTLDSPFWSVFAGHRKSRSAVRPPFH